MNKFQAMQCFVTVADLGSFTAAGRKLMLSTSAVTKHINRLEEHLGVQLLVRSTRQMHLSEAGADYFERCKLILEEVDEAEDAILDACSSASGTVRVAMPPAFARRTLIPALPRFFAEHPAVSVDLKLKGQTTNPIENGYDLVVHSGRLPDSRLINRILVRGRQKTVASPEYLRRFGVPKVPADLETHNCIIGAFGPSWSFTDPAGGETLIRVNGNFTTDSGDILRESAIAGLGVSQATWWLFRDALETGALEPVLTEFEVEAEPISIVFPAQKNTPAKVRVFADFLVKLTRENHAP
ncbi:LysR family transcriptional regulator [Halovulum marinum]|uniref:LysR family transcriptional regulator n=1 Tax=Halovulum marinum TaxID=2662447 RepID=UPI002D79B028|nr:LysR substrate-binding domain-containing protein [Halovulum marinum]